ENEIAFLLTRFVKEHRLGRIWTGDVGFKLLEDRVRAPDVAFMSRDRLAKNRPPRKGFYHRAPGLSGAVLLPGDAAGGSLATVSRFLEAGICLVWIVDPPRRTVTVYRANGEVFTLRVGDTLSGEDVLPGFSCSVAELFPET